MKWRKELIFMYLLIFKCCNNSNCYFQKEKFKKRGMQLSPYTEYMPAHNFWMINVIFYFFCCCHYWKSVCLQIALFHYAVHYPAMLIPKPSSISFMLMFQKLVNTLFLLFCYFNTTLILLFIIHFFFILLMDINRNKSLS